MFLNRRRLLALLGLGPTIGVASSVREAASAQRTPVRVLFTRVNGEHYYQARDSIASLTAGDRVMLRREPENAHDRRAIEVLDTAGRKLGYVARIDNSAVARMMVPANGSRHGSQGATAIRSTFGWR